MSAFASRIRLARQGESQAAFAARFGLKVAVYSHYETGRREPSLDTISLIAKVLNVSADWLLGLDGSASTVVTASPGAVVAHNSTVTVAPAPEKPSADCRKCPYKAAVARLKKAGMAFPGLA